MTEAVRNTNLEEIGTKGMEKLFPKVPKIGVSMATCGLASGKLNLLSTFINQANQNSSMVT
ncbi:MAG: hypothetical protein ACTSQF_11975 [Candidatus Heimdallarchaeaceae archaeon]